MSTTVPTRADRGKDRRAQQRRFHFPERRSGFDRRGSAASGLRARYDLSLRNYRDRRATFLLVLATIIVFNFIDYLLTVRVLEAGGVELNPVMARLFEISPTLAALLKLGVGGGAVLFLLRLRRYRRSLEASLVLLMGFTVLMFYHAYLALNYPG